MPRATSKDEFTWEEHELAVGRLPKGQYGWRSVSTPDILAWGGKYYLHYQGFNEIPGLKGDRAAAAMAEADSPNGPRSPSTPPSTTSAASEGWGNPNQRKPPIDILSPQQTDEKLTCPPLNPT